MGDFDIGWTPGKDCLRDHGCGRIRIYKECAAN